MAIMGFLFPALSIVDPRFPVARRHAADCHISAEPATLFLLIWSRTGGWRRMLPGRMSIWGRRPWLAVRLPRMLRNP
jgi:hypothetical protein